MGKDTASIRTLRRALATVGSEERVRRSSPRWTSSPECLKNAKMLGNERFIVAHRLHRPTEGNATRVENHHLVRQAEGELHVLFHQHDRLTLAFKPRDGAS